MKVNLPALLGLFLLTPTCIAGPVKRQNVTDTPPPEGVLTPEVIELAGGGPPNATGFKLTPLGIGAVQLLLFLEELEVVLYYDGYRNITSGQWDLTGLPNNTAEVIAKTAAQEDVHVTTLIGLLEGNNATFVKKCKYSFPASNVRDFLAIANIITPANYGSIIGVQNLLAESNPGIVLSSSSILATEVTHETFIRQAVGELPNPAAFETGIPPSWGYNIGRRYTVPGSCPGGIDYPIYPPLYLQGRPAPAFASNTMPTTINLEWDANQYWVEAEVDGRDFDANPLYVCWVNLANAPVYTKLTVTGSGQGTTEVPRGLQNIAFVAITAGTPDTISVLDGLTLAGPLAIPIS